MSNKIRNIQKTLLSDNWYTLNKFSFDYQNFHCTFSAGICQAMATDQTDQLIDQADKALYASKHAGRNQTQFYQKPD